MTRETSASVLRLVNLDTHLSNELWPGQHEKDVGERWDPLRGMATIRLDEGILIEAEGLPYDARGEGDTIDQRPRIRSDAVVGIPLSAHLREYCAVTLCAA